jgi:hypothetical protein
MQRARPQPKKAAARAVDCTLPVNYLGRIRQGTDEQQRSGLVVLNRVKKWMIHRHRERRRAGRSDAD